MVWCVRLAKREGRGREREKGGGGGGQSENKRKETRRFKCREFSISLLILLVRKVEACFSGCFLLTFNCRGEHEFNTSRLIQGERDSHPMDLHKTDNIMILSELKTDR